MSLKDPVIGTFPAAHKMLLSCWSLAVPVGLCSEYLLFKHVSTDLPVKIGSGREILDSAPGIEGAGAGPVGGGVDGVTQPTNRITMITGTHTKSAFFI
jgi:hypothetical protein